MGSTPSKPTNTEPRDSEKADTAGGIAKLCADLRITAPLSSKGAPTIGYADAVYTAAEHSPILQHSRIILSHSNIRESLVSRSARIADAHVFNTGLEFKTGPITSQKSSGRCWLFATTNVLRYSVMKKLNLSEFQLSQVRL